MKTSKTNAFTLIELLVVISIIAILAGIALPVFSEVLVRGNQTKALSNAKQVATACSIWAMDYQGNFPHYKNMDPDPATGQFTEATGTSANSVLAGDLIPDYLADKTVFSIPKSAYCKVKTPGKSTELVAGENEWAYIMGLSNTSVSRWPLIVDGPAPGASISSGGHYVADDTQPGGVWRAKKAVCIRVDMSGAVETLYHPTGQTGSQIAAVIKRDGSTKDALMQDANSDPAWLTGGTLLVPDLPQ